MTAFNAQERATEESFALDCCRQHLRVYYPGWRESQPSPLARLNPLVFTASNGLPNADERGFAIFIPQWELVRGDATTASVISRHFIQVRRNGVE